MRARIMGSVLVLVGVLAAASLGGCNKQKPPVLDYTQKEDGFFASKGKPGEAHVGRSPTDEEHNGFQFGAEGGQAKPGDPNKKPVDPPVDPKDPPKDPPKSDKPAEGEKT